MRRLFILFALVGYGCSAVPAATRTSTPEPTPDYGDFEDLEGLAYGIMYAGYMCVDFLTYSETQDDVMDSYLECKLFF